MRRNGLRDGYCGLAGAGGASEFFCLGRTRSLEERELIGFPVPKDDYWTAETLAGVAARFPNMDMSPYTE